MITEFRKYISELLLGWAFEIRPSDEFKKNLREFILKNYKL